MGGSNSRERDQFKEPLVNKDSVEEPGLQEIYESFGKTADPRNIGDSSLLDPSGHLSDDLQAVLDDEFMKYSNGLLVITRNELKNFLIACYPQLMTNDHDYYNDRVNYILSRYGKPFKDVRNHFAKILNITLPPLTTSKKDDNFNSTDNPTINAVLNDTSKNDSSTTSGVIDEDVKEREARLVKESLMSTKTNFNNKNNNSNNNSSNKLHLRKTKTGKSGSSSSSSGGGGSSSSGGAGGSSSSVSIQEDQNVIEKTINCSFISENEIVLPKTKFLLFYRKSCFDREMMVRLELTELGYSQFRGMLVDRSKSVDVLAYKVQQLRNQEETHLEEKNRILNAQSAKDSADDIINFISNRIDPLDRENDSENPYRKRRPIKFGACCYTCCPCIVCLARCCC